jgi:hypothetical protein
MDGRDESGMESEITTSNSCIRENRKFKKINTVKIYTKHSPKERQSCSMLQLN